MIDEAKAYIEYLSRFRAIDRPQMPKFDVETYTDNEYKVMIHKIEEDFQYIDEVYLTEKYLKGE